MTHRSVATLAFNASIIIKKPFHNTQMREDRKVLIDLNDFTAV
jgi:hypothetical protein